jgi:hypothetical protein
VICVDELTV